MGNTPSDLLNEEPVDIWWTNGDNQEVKETVTTNPNEEKDIHENFIEEFDRKREKRKLILESKRQEIQNIRKELEVLRLENERLKKNNSRMPPQVKEEQIQQLQAENERLKCELEEMLIKEKETGQLLEKNKELRISVSEMQSEVQNLNSCVLDFEQQKLDYKKHVVALKDVIKVSKELLMIRENELKELKDKMNKIECAFKDREASLMSNDLRREYEKQLTNIRTLRELYEERSRTYRQETAILRSQLAEKDKEIEEMTQKMSELNQRIDQVENDNSEKYDIIKSLESNLGLAKAETRQYKAELAVINQLFSHILLAFNNSPELDLDKLLKQLEENHDLLKDIVTNEISSEVSSALPKVLLDLVSRISGTVDETSCDNNDAKISSSTEEKDNSNTTLHNLNSPAEIAENLPKVWRVLIELLSHQSANISEPDSSEEDENRCYKTVSTPKGPSLVLSVSKTFFRLKELIIEKKTLEKDMSNLKQLNSHLESRLQEQEKRFDFVSSELSKTWSFVAKLQKEHHLLHTQEQILRYELAQKRKLLKELKGELEYSREKWQEAREKNSKTEKEWLILRKEFAARKKASNNEDGNHSVESGYSDEREESSDEEPGYETDISEGNLKGDDNEISEEIAPIVNEDTPDVDFVTLQVSAAQTNDSPDTPSILNVIQSEITSISVDLPNDTSSLLNDDFTAKHNENMAQNGSHVPSQSEADETESPSTSTKLPQTLEERLALRDERLKRLEGQCRALVSQVTHTSNRSVAICNKLEGLHEVYGESSRGGRDNRDMEQNTPSIDDVEEENGEKKMINLEWIYENDMT